ncbi:phage tail tape measure protein [Scandinavium goeteborgense]|uniref:phage tail tape measure protein n=1 Tax=Scandinavium goeteborgense TaxID=1851514 RepID=UPI000F682B2C|nr:phage tail tape measure protein [Scandinavium goeteborgense]QKN82061.1 phage tail tape measure protein [Scandinavium goeteborgense]
MGVLDTFVFLLETDNKNALKGFNETDNAMGEVQGASVDTRTQLLNIFNGVGEKAGFTIDNFKELAVATLGIAGAGLSLNAVLDHTAEMLQKVRDAETVGVDISQYDALSRTFQSLGVEADAFRDSMVDLNESLGEAASDAKSGKAQAFKQFGVSLRDTQGNIKSADEALLELSDTMSKMDKQQATFQIKQLGITDNAVISAMLNGRKELERQIKFQKDLGVTSNDDAEQLKQFAEAQNELSAIFTRFADVLAMTVVPALDLLIDTTIAVIKWGREHKSFLLTFLGVLATAALPSVTAAFWGMATAAWAAVAPFLPFIAAVAALVLVIDDLWNYFNGGESVIGDLAKKFPMLGAALDRIKDSVIGAWNALKLLFDNPGAFMDAFVAELKNSWNDIVSMTENAADQVWQAVVKAWDKLSSSTKKVFSDLLAYVKDIFSHIGDYISDSVSNAAKDAGNAVKNFLGLGDDEPDPEPKEPAPKEPAPKETAPRQKKNTPGGKDMLIPGDDPVQEKPVPPTGRERKSKSDDDPLQQSASLAGNAHKAITTAAAMPVIPPNPAAVSGARTTTVSNQQHIDNVNITTGSGDPQQISSAVSNGMGDSVRQMTAQYDDGRSH